MHQVLLNVQVHIYLSGLHLPIRSPKHKPLVCHLQDITPPKSFREAHGLQLGTMCVEDHIQIVRNQWIVLEV